MTTHLIMLGSNASAIAFPDAASEPTVAIAAKLMNAAAAVANLASMEHECGEVYSEHAAGAMTALEVLTGFANALAQEAQTHD